MTVIDVVSGTLMLLAVAFVLLGALGLQRFDDVFSRIHAATKPMTLGVVLVAAGAAPQMDRTSDVVKLALAVVLQLISAPVAAHMIGRAAYWDGNELSPETTIDELAESDLRPRG